MSANGEEGEAGSRTNDSCPHGRIEMPGGKKKCNREKERRKEKGKENEKEKEI